MANLVTYAKQKWEDAKTAITAARLNNMEDGINNCATQINALGDSVSRAMGNHGKSDLDDVITPGVYTVRPPDVANLPAFTNEYAILIVLASEKNVLVQVYVRSGAGKVFVRTKWSAGFSAWYRYDGAMVAQVSADQAQ